MSAPDSAPSADRNLLFGILALQMDFVSRDALLKAMHAWVLQKATPLGQILLDQGTLRADTHALLEALVQKHLQLHGGDAQKSLAAVSSLGSARQQLEQIADAELHQSLAHVAAAHAVEDDPLATRPPSAGEPTSSGQRFRILRPHARGGLGEVFVAHDTELGREVALKEIQDRHADDPNSRSRFVLEAEITGGLEHPGIVPVYGLGQYADGRPFYAMRFIKGDSLQQAIARFHKADAPGRDAGERALALRQLLGRFIDVCDAIAYAHSRGVLHRDLKPGNVMLGKYGETLVVDWGLAKPLGRAEAATETMEGPLRPSSASGSTPTQMGSALGTPAFMPPEQAAGRLDQLGPASDVYSLGATLYCLLTGQPPFEGTDLGEVLRRVQQGEFRPPRQVKDTVPAALEAVCLKAMAFKPEDRYASPRALAEDIEHWLADEPVSAWREPWRVRARRWVSRHRTLVTTAVATLLVATVSLTAATLLLQAANTRERQANDAKEAALRQAEDNAAEARRQQELALRQKRQAEVNGAEARRQQELALRQKRQAEDNALEAKHQKEMAEKQKRETEKQAAIALAVNVFLRNDLLGQADISQQRIGGREERDPDVKVRTLLDRASASIEGKFTEQPLTEAAIRLTMGETYRALGRYEEAQRHLECSVRLRTAKLGADHPHALLSKNSLAALYHAQGKYDLAEPLLKEVLQTRTAKLGVDHPHTLHSKNNLAALYWRMGRLKESVPLFEEVLPVQRKRLGVDHPDTLGTMADLGINYRDAGRIQDAIPLLEEAVQRAGKRPGGVPYSLAWMPNVLAETYDRAGLFDKSEPLYRAFLAQARKQFGDEHPATAAQMAVLSLNLLRQKKYADAEPILRECLTIREKKQPDVWLTFNTRSMLGDALLGQKKYTEAEPLLVQGYEGMKARQDKIPPQVKVRLTEALERLVHLYDATGKKDKADDYRKKLEAERAKASPKKK